MADAGGALNRPTEHRGYKIGRSYAGGYTVKRATISVAIGIAYEYYIWLPVGSLSWSVNKYSDGSYVASAGSVVYLGSPS